MVVGQSEAINAVVTLATQVGTSRASTVLVCGETGTGKELFAVGFTLVHRTQATRSS